LVSEKKRKKKLRVAFRKNRQKRTRSNDLTRTIRDHGTESADFVTGERLTGKGELTRYRTVISTDGTPADSWLRDVDETKCLSGRVISSAGLYSVVQVDDGTRYRCTVRRVLRTMFRESRNAVVAGDRVLFQPSNEDQGVIERVDPRRGTISRCTQRREHVIVANVDRVLVVTSADDPPLKTNLIDRFLVSAETGQVRPIVCINKIDLVNPASLQPIAGLYGRLGCDVVLTSVLQSRGLVRLRHLLTGHETVLAGQSGVGKSSLLNAIQPGLALKTGSVSTGSGKGRHTTRRAELLPLRFGGWVVDTPGIRQFALWDVICEDVEGFFIEFRPFVALCRFPDCSHTHESDCAVKQAVHDNLIASTRYESYLRLVSDEQVPSSE